MKESKAFLLLAVVAAVLILGVAYAAITAVNFNVTGTATTAPAEDASNYQVAITAASVKSSSNSEVVDVDFTYEENIGTYTITGLKEVGDFAEVEFTITNSSTDLKAVLSGLETVISGADKDYFTVTEGALDTLEIAPGGVAKLTAKVEVKTASLQARTVTVQTTFTATPQDK